MFSFRDFIHWVDEFGVKLEEMRQSRISSATVAESNGIYLQTLFGKSVFERYCRILQYFRYLSEQDFPQELGKGVQEYLIDRRIKKLKKLLMETNKKYMRLQPGWISGSCLL